MKNQRILLGLIWLTTVIIAYFAGSTGTSPQIGTTHGSSQPDVKAGRDSEGRAPVVRKLDASEEESGERGKTNIAILIARARVEFGSGMGGMMNIRGMMRAMAPLVELDDSQLQEALAEIEKTIKEPQQKMMFYSILLGQWAEKDGKAALEYAEKNMKNNAMFDFGVKASILGAWARSNPEAAWRWFESEGKASGNERTATDRKSVV